MPNDDAPLTLQRVVNTTSGEYAWLNLQTSQIITDDEMITILEAQKTGAVAGDPLESDEWIVADSAVGADP